MLLRVCHGTLFDLQSGSFSRPPALDHTEQIRDHPLNLPFHCPNAPSHRHIDPLMTPPVAKLGAAPFVSSACPAPHDLNQVSSLTSPGRKSPTLTPPQQPPRSSPPPSSLPSANHPIHTLISTQLSSHFPHTTLLHTTISPGKAEHMPSYTGKESKAHATSHKGSELKHKHKRNIGREAHTASKTTLIIRLHPGHTATSSPSRRSAMEISKRSPQGQG